MSLFKRKKSKEQKDEKQAEKSVDVKADKKVPLPAKGEVKKDKQPKKKEAGKTEIKKTGVAYKVLIHPLITEKSNIQSSLNQYVFIVDNRANKVEIKKAIQEIYHVKPTQVKIINVLGKMVRTGRRGVLSRRKNWKKAIITLPAGKKIDVYET